MHGGDIIVRTNNNNIIKSDDIVQIPDKFSSIKCFVKNCVDVKLNNIDSSMGFLVVGIVSFVCIIVSAIIYYIYVIKKSTVRNNSNDKDSNDEDSISNISITATF